MLLVGSGRGTIRFVRFVRYQSALPNARGTYPGIFALANGLARTGRLSRADWVWWRASNDTLELAYTDPATVDPTIFDRRAHPEVSCWFKASSTYLLAAADAYTALLDRYAVPWVRVRSENPGLVLYEDNDQVVVAPQTTSAPTDRVHR